MGSLVCGRGAAACIGGRDCSRLSPLLRHQLGLTPSSKCNTLPSHVMCVGVHFPPPRGLGRTFDIRPHPRLPVHKGNSRLRRLSMLQARRPTRLGGLPAAPRTGLAGERAGPGWEGATPPAPAQRRRRGLRGARTGRAGGALSRPRGRAVRLCRVWRVPAGEGEQQGRRGEQSPQAGARAATGRFSVSAANPLPSLRQLRGLLQGRLAGLPGGRGRAAVAPRGTAAEFHNHSNRISTAAAGRAASSPLAPPPGSLAARGDQGRRPSSQVPDSQVRPPLLQVLALKKVTEEREGPRSGGQRRRQRGALRWRQVGESTLGSRRQLCLWL